MWNYCGCYSLKKKDIDKEIYISNPSLIEKHQKAGFIIMKYYKNFKENKIKKAIALKEFDRFLKGLIEIKSSVQKVEVILIRKSIKKLEYINMI